MAKRRFTFSSLLPPYAPPRNEWRRRVHAAVLEAQAARGVGYSEGDRLEVRLELYLGGRPLAMMDIDDRVNDVIDALRGHIAGPGRTAGAKERVGEMGGGSRAAAGRGELPPIPVATDQEGGTVVRVGYRAVFPSAMAIGATGNPDYAERAARAVAEGLRADGITVNHAPVCDVNSEPRNPVIGTRSFGDDPERVAAFAAAWVRGSEGAGVAATPKHFPGHGDATIDSHLARPDVTADRATLERRELVPFVAAFAAGASMVMTAHVRYPALDASGPATVSRAVLTDLLRGELGFAGLCVSDSLDMAGIAQVGKPAEIVARSLAAGVDAVMVTSGINRQLAAAGWIAERVPPERTREALGRATVFRERFAADVPAADVDDGAARALAAEIAAASITHVGPPLPRFDGPLRVTYFAPTSASPVEELADPATILEEALRRRMG